jgi:hypothetical protein
MLCVLFLPTGELCSDQAIHQYIKWERYFTKPLLSFLYTVVPGYLDHFSQTVLVSRHQLGGTYSSPSFTTLCRIIRGSILRCRLISRMTKGPE